MARVITVSNRLPFSVKLTGTGFELVRNIGGVATGLSAAELGKKSVWIGWPGLESAAAFRTKSERKNFERFLARKNLRPVFLSDDERDGYYNGFCNSTLWPLFHYFPQFARCDESEYEIYRKVNEKFARSVLEVAHETDTIWIHDFHLMLVPSLVREKLPGAAIGFFLHTPFPSSEIFRMIPQRSEILGGLLGADLIGFHTFDYVRHFAESARRVRGLENSLGVFSVGDRLVKADMFPMGVDVRKFSAAPLRPAVRKKIADNKISRNSKIILSIDRLDYTKGLEKRLEAYDLFLRKNPKWRGRVSLLMIAVPSRTEVERYEILRSSVERRVSEINGKWGALSWEPVKYLYRSFDFEGMISLYLLADVLFITPARDGMNLIVKEYAASRTDGSGAIILSETAGTSRELGEALIVNPNDISAASDALAAALEMPPAAGKRRMKAMRRRLLRYDLARWKTDFLDKLKRIKKRQEIMSSKRLSEAAVAGIVKKFRRSHSSLVLFDYDGTLVPFSENPDDAKPDETIIKHLRAIKKNPRVKLVIISGRDRKTLSKWLADASDAIVAEHGAWIKDGAKWERAVAPAGDWKKEVSLILEIFTDRTPGSFVETKDSSVAWHYRKVDPSLAAMRLGELNEALANAVQNLGVRIMQGSRVVEVRHFSLNKGAPVHRLLSAGWDCVIAMGDDATDEDMFGELPPEAHSVKIGHPPTKARFYLPSVEDARRFVRKLAGVK